MAAGLHISISAEKIASIGGLNISNSIFTSLIVSFLLILFALLASSKLKSTTKPKGLQNLVEFVIEALDGLVMSVTNDLKKSRQFFPFIATFLIFILANNWFGLLPGVGTIGFLESSEETTHAQLLPSSTQLQFDSLQAQASTTTTAQAGQTATGEKVSAAEPTEEKEAAAPTFVPYLRAGTADLNTTLALGLISIFLTQMFGFMYQKLGYLTKFFNFSNPIMFFVGLLELISEIAKIISFAFRLFGNIFAGEVLLAVIGSLAALVVPMPFYGLEIFVGFIQALVFAMLSVVFFNMATLGHSDH